MKIVFRSAVLFLVGILPIIHATAEENQPAATTGLAALRTVGTSGQAGKGAEILGMVGFFGDPQPSQWLVLTRPSNKPGALVEWVVRDGKMITSRKVKKDSSQDMPSIPIRIDGIQVDSAEAGAIAGNLARSKQIEFSSIHFQLRCRDEKEEPVWAVHLLGANQVAVGVHYISAASGEVLRSVWHVKLPSPELSQRTSDASEGRSIRMVRPIPRRPEL